MNKDDRFYIKELQPIRAFCLNSDKEDVYEYIYSLQQDKQQLQQKLNQLETNWNELKQWLIANDVYYPEAILFKETLHKMRELEGGSNE